jgi:two-component SAPR family response regulator
LKKIIIVDDSKFMTKIIAEKISNISKAIEIIQVQDPTIIRDQGVKSNTTAIIIDYNMPLMNGLELISNIREYNSNIKILLLSASTKFTNHKFENDPNFTYALKPISDIDLEIFIKSIL